MSSSKKAKSSGVSHRIRKLIKRISNKYKKSTKKLKSRTIGSKKRSKKKKKFVKIIPITTSKSLEKLTKVESGNSTTDSTPLKTQSLSKSARNPFDSCRTQDTSIAERCKWKIPSQSNFIESDIPKIQHKRGQFDSKTEQIQRFVDVEELMRARDPSRSCLISDKSSLATMGIQPTNLDAMGDESLHNFTKINVSENLRLCAPKATDLTPREEAARWKRKFKAANKRNNEHSKIYFDADVSCGDL